MRTSDIRFLVYDECEKIARLNDRRVMKRGVTPTIKERGEQTTAIEADCYWIDPEGIPEDQVDMVLALDFDQADSTVGRYGEQAGTVQIEFDCRL